eukprot:jgi/Bigna1/79660/fgenesh1_pg.64_\
MGDRRVHATEPQQQSLQGLVSTLLVVSHSTSQQPASEKAVVETQRAASMVAQSSSPRSESDPRFLEISEEMDWISTEFEAAEKLFSPNDRKHTYCLLKGHTLNSSSPSAMSQQPNQSPLFPPMLLPHLHWAGQVATCESPEPAIWDEFTQQLDPSAYNAVRIGSIGSMLLTHTCTDQVIAQTIARAIRDSTPLYIQCQGVNWRVGTCGNCTEGVNEVRDGNVVAPVIRI